MRIAGVLPLGMLAACTEQDVSEAIGDWVKSALWFIARMILISLGLLLAWAFAAMLGGALIALGIRRRRADVATVAAIVAGIGIVVAAWPLVFSDSGLAGVMAPGSSGGVTAGPIVGQALAVVGAVVAVIVFLKRRDKKKPAPPAAAQQPPLAPPPPVEPPAPAPVVASAKPPAKRKTAVKRKPAAKAKAKAGAGSRP